MCLFYTLIVAHSCKIIGHKNAIFSNHYIHKSFITFECSMVNEIEIILEVDNSG